MTDAILDRLMRLHPKLIDLELGGSRLLADVGSHHLKLPPVVHVAGTTARARWSPSARHGRGGSYRVHVYTSPQLVRFNERIRVARRADQRRHLEDVLTEAEQANREQPITFFEITPCRRSSPSRACRPTLPCSVGMAGATTPPRVIPYSRPSRRSATTTRASSRHMEKIAPRKQDPEGTVPAVIGLQREASASVIAARAAELACAAFHGTRMSVHRRPAASATTATFLGIDLRRPHCRRRTRSTMRDRRRLHRAAARGAFASTTRR